MNAYIFFSFNLWLNCFVLSRDVINFCPLCNVIRYVGSGAWVVCEEPDCVILFNWCWHLLVFYCCITHVLFPTITLLPWIKSGWDGCQRSVVFLFFFPPIHLIKSQWDSYSSTFHLDKDWDLIKSPFPGSGLNNWSRCGGDISCSGFLAFISGFLNF